MSTPTNIPTDHCTVVVIQEPAPTQTLSRFLLSRLLYALLGLGSMLAFGWVSHQLMGQAFLDALAQTQASLYGLMLAGLSIGVYAIMSLGFASTRQSVWLPIKTALIAGWLIPTLPGPIGESISPAAYVLLSVLS